MSTQTPIRVRLRVAEDPEPVRLKIGTQIVAGTDPPYEGPFEVTPGDEAQVLPTAGTRVAEDIVVGPIPRNYGLIAWDGNTLTVS